MTVEPHRTTNGASAKRARLVEAAHDDVSAAKGRFQGVYEAARSRFLEPRIKTLRALWEARHAQLSKLIGSAQENARAGLKSKPAQAADSGERALTAREEAEDDG